MQIINSLWLIIIGGNRMGNKLNKRRSIIIMINKVNIKQQPIKKSNALKQREDPTMGRLEYTTWIRAVHPKISFPNLIIIKIQTHHQCITTLAQWRVYLNWCLMTVKIAINAVKWAEYSRLQILNFLGNDHLQYVSKVVGLLAV